MLRLLGELRAAALLRVEPADLARAIAGLALSSETTERLRNAIAEVEAEEQP